MAHDEAEEERAFLADLVPRTGRDLAAWMRAISEQGFSDKNDAIDWLRTQGFPFARASWLERIHSNGGRPIYLEGPPQPAIATPTPPEPKPAPAPKPVPPREEAPAKVEAAAPAGEAPSLESLIAAAKGYRPLYLMLEAAIRQAVPAVMIAPRASFVAFSAAHEFAVVQALPSEIRLGLALGDRPHDANLGPVRIRGASAGITHQITLKDARQINGELQAIILAAATRT